MSESAQEIKRKATYEDVLAAPANLIAELLDGELVLSPRPAPRHALASSAVGADLFGAFGRRTGDGGPGGWWILDEPEIHLGGDVIVPDLAGWRRERLPRLPEDAHFSLAPDWACEVISPRSASNDRVQKMRIYAREGVLNVWLIDPIGRTLEVFRLEKDRWILVSTHAEDEKIRVEPFDAIELALADWWTAPSDEETHPETHPGQGRSTEAEKNSTE